jgi:hypothetical protein
MDWVTVDSGMEGLGGWGRKKPRRGRDGSVIFEAVEKGVEDADDNRNNEPSPSEGKWE